MPIKPCPLNINTKKQETDNRGTPMFPCAGYITTIGDCFSANIPWHWHEEIEPLVVCEGVLKLELIDKCYYIVKDPTFLNLDKKIQNIC